MKKCANIITPDPSQRHIIIQGVSVNDAKDAALKFTVDAKDWIWQGIGVMDNGDIVGPIGLKNDLILFLESRGYTILEPPPKIRENMWLTAEIEAFNHILHANRGFRLRDYQKYAIEVGSLAPFGVFEIGTGGGKSIIMAGLCRMNQGRSLIIVDSIDLMRQMKDTLTGVMKPHQTIGTVGAGTNNWQNVTVGIINSIAQEKHATQVADQSYVIIDECHLSACKRFAGLTERLSSAKSLHGFTGTFTRSNPDEMTLLKAITGDVIYRRKSSDMIVDGVIPSAEITMVRHPNKYKTREAIMLDRDRNMIGAMYATSQAYSNLAGMIFTTRVKHAKYIKDLIINDLGFDANRIAVCTGETSKTDRKLALQRLGNKDIDILVATKIFEKGIDVPSMDYAVNLKGELTQVGCLQSLGRILRGTGVKQFIDIYDTSPKRFRLAAERRAMLYNMQWAMNVNTVDISEFSKDLIVAVCGHDE